MNQSRWATLRPLALIALVAALSNGIFLAVLKPSRELESDAPYFLSLAENLAHGKGYLNNLSPWPSTPATDRMPVWPFIVSGFVRAAPHRNPRALIRIAGAIFNVLTAVVIWLLSRRFSRNRGSASLAALMYSFYPPALYLADQGMSEVVFVFLLFLGLLCLDKGAWAICAALLGLACLTRPNLLLLLPVAALLFWLQKRAHGSAVGRLGAWRGLFLACIFLLPTALWTLRNLGVSGRFPVISTLSGQTLYGSNNSVVMEKVEYWGYWITPDWIPGEKSKRDLASTLSPVEVDQYYSHRGLQFIKASGLSLPRLLLGKLIRAYVPVPWNASFATYGAFGARLLVLALFFATARFWKLTVPRLFTFAIWAAFLVNTATTLIYYGSARFSFWVECLMVPCVGIGLVEMAKKRAATISETSPTSA